MPGIFGIVDKSGEQSDGRNRELGEMLQKMSAAMRYESFYGAELVSCPELGVYVGRVGFEAKPSRNAAEPPALTVLTSGEPIIERYQAEHPPLLPVRAFGSG